MVKVKKHWLVFIVILLVSIHIYGSTFRGLEAYNIGEAIGYLLLPTLIGFGIVYRAKTTRAVIAGHLTLLVLCGGLLAVDFNNEREDQKKELFAACRSESADIKGSELSEFEKDQLCTCFTEVTLDPYRWHFMSRSFFFKEIEPIEQNEYLQSLYVKASLNCNNVSD